MSGLEFEIPLRAAHLRQAAGLEHGQASLLTKGFLKLHAVGLVDIKLELPSGTAGAMPVDAHVYQSLSDIPTPLVILPNRRLIPLVSVARMGVESYEEPLPAKGKILVRSWFVRLEGQDHMGGWWSTPLLPGGRQYRAFRMLFYFEPYYLVDQPEPPIARVQAFYQLMEVEA